MRNLKAGSLDAGSYHHRGKYCSYVGEYWRDSIQYLRDIKEIDLNIKKDR